MTSLTDILESQHAWDLPPREAKALQSRLAGRVIRKSRFGSVTTVAGVDSGYRGGVICAAVVVLRYPDLQFLEQAVAIQPVRFPYLPGLLSFREGPAILAALARLRALPDLMIFDGHGVAHPRRFGIASHLGLVTGIPAIGCAKTRLVGNYREPRLERGSVSDLLDGSETVGAVLRTRTNVKPVFVSTGHRIDLRDAVRFVLNTCRGFRLPEVIRRADQFSCNLG
jgi:deoxyribonuclease V